MNYTLIPQHLRFPSSAEYVCCLQPFFSFETVSGWIAQASLGVENLLLLPPGSQVLGLQAFITMPTIDFS